MFHPRSLALPLLAGVIALGSTTARADFAHLVLDSQSDGELIVIRHFGSTDQEVFRLALSLGGSPVQIDDTVFATSSEGIILLSDRDGETVYSITRNTFAPSDAYSATPNSVGRLDFDTGVITPVVTGLSSPHGMVFINQ